MKLKDLIKTNPGLNEKDVLSFEDKKDIFTGKRKTIKIILDR